MEDSISYPRAQIMEALRNEVTSEATFQKILNIGLKEVPSTVWSAFKALNFERDVAAIRNWLEAGLKTISIGRLLFFEVYPRGIPGQKTKNFSVRIYGEITDLNIDAYYYPPTEIENVYAEFFVKGFDEISEILKMDPELTEPGYVLAETIIFLGYSGDILMDVLMNSVIDNNFSSLWGLEIEGVFSERFLLMEKWGEKRILKAEFIAPNDDF